MPVVTIKVDFSEIEDAFDRLLSAMDDRLDQAMLRTLDETAQKIKDTKQYTDRTGALKESTQSAGTTGSFMGGNLEGLVGFGAVSESGFEYGLALEFGSDGGWQHGGIEEGVWMFARDSIDHIVETTGNFEEALKRAVTDAGLG